jgi:hypothetical protein
MPYEATHGGKIDSNMTSTCASIGSAHLIADGGDGRLPALPERLLISATALVVAMLPLSGACACRKKNHGRQQKHLGRHA